VVYDLGCGDGRIVIAAAKKYGARGVGIDLDPARIREARANAKEAGVENLVTFKVADLFETDLTEATVVTLYLLPSLNRRLMPKLFAELKPGARVVSHDFDMGRDWPPDKYIKLGNDGIYVWKMPPYAERPTVVGE
jgi:cyclopropane fatty-acyl-phospholipid synthase-like methyltransferase